MVGPESGARPSQEGSQGALNISVPKEWSEKDFADRVSLICNEFVMTALPTLFTMVANGEGKQELEVFVDEGGKKGEKRRVIDLTAHHLFRDIVRRQTDLPSVIFSEEDVDTFLPRDVTEKTKFIAWSLDPIENSSPYAKGVEGAGVFCGGSAFDQDGNVIMGFFIDLERARVLVSKDGKNIMQTYEMVEKPNGDPNHKTFMMKDPNPKTSQEVFPSRRKTLSDPDATFYTFMGEKKWSKLADEFLPTLRDKFFDSKTHSELSRGGSHIYPFYLANGKGEAYAISEEPVSEIFPAWAAIVNAGLTIFGVKKDGSMTEIKFNPRELLKNPKFYKEGYVDFLVAAVTPEIADQIKIAYLEQLKENKIREAKIAFADSHPEEFEVFRSTRQAQNPPTN